MRVVKKPAQRRRVGEIDAFGASNPRVGKRMQHARDDLTTNVLLSHPLLDDVGVARKRIGKTPGLPDF